MKPAVAKTVFLISALSIVDPSNGRGQLLDGTKVGGDNVEHFDAVHQIDNLDNINHQVEDYNLMLKKTGGVQNIPTTKTTTPTQTTKIYSGANRNAN